MVPDKILVNYFKNHIAQFGLDKLKEQALKDGKSPQEIELAIQFLKEQKILPPDPVVAVPSSNPGLISSSYFSKKTIFLWLFVLGAFFLVAVVAGFLFFGGGPTSEEYKPNGLVASIRPVQINEDVLRTIRNRGVPNSLYLKYEVNLPRELRSEGYPEFNILEFYQKREDSILKSKLFMKDKSGKIFLEALVKLKLDGTGRMEDIISAKVCTLGFCTDATTFAGDNKASMLYPVLIHDGAPFVGKLNLLEVDSFCFEVSNFTIGNNTIYENSINCMHPDYNILLYRSIDNEGNLEDSEVITREFGINPTIPEEIFFLDESQGFDLGDFNVLASEIEEFTRNLASSYNVTL